jgi:hypothetical protein
MPAPSRTMATGDTRALSFETRRFARLLRMRIEDLRAAMRPNYFLANSDSGYPPNFRTGRSATWLTIRAMPRLASSISAVVSSW